MNKLELRRVQEENILIDILVSLQDTREDFIFDKNKFPITLGTFTFSKYTTQDLFLINESFKNEVFHIKFLDFFMNGESLDNYAESHHDSEADIVIGYLAINTIKEGIFKTKNRLLKINKTESTHGIESLTFIFEDNKNVPTYFSVNNLPKQKLHQTRLVYKILYKIFKDGPISCTSYKEALTKKNTFNDSKSELKRLGFNRTSELLKISKSGNNFILTLENREIFKEKH